jgi:Nitroreductase
VYVYDAEANVLVCVDERDLSALAGTQEFVTVAPVNIAMVADRTKIKGKTPQGVIETIYADTGFISQNIYLFCTSAGLSSVTRAMIDKEALAAALNLSPDQTITLIHTVGWPA